ncbi:MAG: hypothetical protein EOM24_37535, partial [Chloroflexia bacterium]|nr:hypothetical protein [Chloroflexia bacterium]
MNNRPFFVGVLVTSLLLVVYVLWPYAGEIAGRKNGVFIAKEPGKSMAYSIFNLSDRGQMIIRPGEEIYAGMIVGAIPLILSELLNLIIRLSVGSFTLFTLLPLA